MKTIGRRSLLLALALAPAVSTALAASVFEGIDTDNDKTLTKDEYLNYVETVFKRADPDNDGTVDAKEARTHAGRTLLRLLRAR